MSLPVGAEYNNSLGIVLLHQRPSKILEELGMWTLGPANRIQRCP